MTGGYTMFIMDHRLYYDYNFLDGVHYVLRSSPLPKGTTNLKFNFIKTREFGGDGELDRVIITVSDENTVPPRELPANYY